MLDYIKSNPVAGTYQYINNNSGALYVGSADNIWRRHLEHLRPSDIDLAIANEGFENFTFKVLTAFPLGTDRSILRQNERKWIDYFDAENNPLHYNKPLIGGNNTKYHMWNVKKVYYSKRDMFRQGNKEGLRPRKVFKVISPIKEKTNYILPIGAFYEPYTPTLLHDLSQRWS